MLQRFWLCLTMGLVLLSSGTAATLPRKAPDIEISMPSGPAVRLSQYAGKPVVLALILTTCPHCQNTIGLLIGMQREYGARGLQVLAAAVDEGNVSRSVSDFVKRFGTNFPVGYVPKSTTWLDFMQHPTMEVPRMPMLAFIDRNGMIRTQHAATDAAFFQNEIQSLKKEIEAILGPAPGAKSLTKKAPAKTPSKKQG